MVQKFLLHNFWLISFVFLKPTFNTFPKLYLFITISHIHILNVKSYLCSFYFLLSVTLLLNVRFPYYYYYCWYGLSSSYCYYGGRFQNFGMLAREIPSVILVPFTIPVERFKRRHQSFIAGSNKYYETKNEIYLDSNLLTQGDPWIWRAQH